MTIMKMNSWHAKLYIKHCMLEKTYNVFGESRPLMYKGKPVSKDNPKMPTSSCEYWGNLIAWGLLRLALYVWLGFWLYGFYTMYAGTFWIKESGNNDFAFLCGLTSGCFLIAAGIRYVPIFIKFLKKQFCKTLTWE